MGVPPSSTLSVSFFTPWHTRCGIRDYSAHLLAALSSLPDIQETHLVEAPADRRQTGLWSRLRQYGEEEGRFRALGLQMNADAQGRPVDVAHVQHQYFFFGGVGPHKTHIRAFLNAIRVPLVMTVHEIADSGGGSWTGRAIGWANRLNFDHPAIDRLIVHTEADRDRLMRTGIAAAKVCVVRHGVPAALPLPDPDSVRSDWNLKGRRVLTLFGFLSAKKGHRIALEALAHLPPDVTLLFAGDRHPDDHTEYVPELRAEITRRHLDDRIWITGYLPEARIPEIMALTDVALAPFLQSSGSGSLASLFAYGRAIVASDIAPHPEIPQETPVPLELFPAGNADQLAQTVLRLLAEPERRTRLQAAARDYAARHSYLEMARETVGVYRQIARIRPPGPDRA